MAPSIGRYRSGPKLESFMRSCNVEFERAGRSRVPALVECLVELNKGDDARAVMTRIVEAAAAPSDFIDLSEKGPPR